MNIRFFNFLALMAVCLGTALATPAHAAETNAVPESFKASIGGFTGSYNVELRDGALFYSAANGSLKGEPIKVIPSAQDWREFRRSLDDINVWQWRTNYPNSGGVVDGTQWMLSIQFHDRALKTHGDNNFPDKSGKPNGSPEETKAFGLYTAAVRKLLGGKEFQ